MLQTEGTITAPPRHALVQKANLPSRGSALRSLPRPTPLGEKALSFESSSLPQLLLFFSLMRSP